jgi:peptidoglycan hydrolase CwlO-like protein
MDLQEHKTKLEQELIETTEQAKRLSFKMKELTAKIKKLDKAIANAKEIIGEA